KNRPPRRQFPTSLIEFGRQATSKLTIFPSLRTATARQANRLPGSAVEGEILTERTGDSADRSSLLAARYFALRRRNAAIPTPSNPRPQSTTLLGSGVSTTWAAAVDGIQVFPPSVDNSVNTSKKLSMW